MPQTAVADNHSIHLQDTVNISPTTLPGYDEKIKMFYQEHIHTDEEIRYVLDGTGGRELGGPFGSSLPFAVPRTPDGQPGTPACVASPRCAPTPRRACSRLQAISM